MLRLVGFFQELGSGSQYVGSIREVVREDPDHDEDLFVQYLREGYVLLDVTETSTDVISGGERIVGAPSLVSDGRWLWRLDLPHYVARYHLRLPEDFKEHARSMGFQVPVLSESDLAEVGAEAVHYF